MGKKGLNLKAMTQEKRNAISGLTTQKMRYIIAVYQKCIDEESNFSAERQSEPVMVRDRCE